MNTQPRETTSMADAQGKAGTLIEALPWIQRFAGTTMVIKYGGNAMVNDELRRAFAEDVVLLHGHDRDPTRAGPLGTPERTIRTGDRR